MKKALMAAAAFVALPVLAQASDTSIKIDMFGANFKETGINILFSEAAAYRMQDVKVDELSVATMKDGSVGLDFRVIDVGKLDPFEGILALAPVDQTFHDLHAKTADGIRELQIDKGAYADGKLFLAMTRKTIVPRDRTRWAPPTPPAPLALGIDKSLTLDRSNLSAGAIDFQGRNNDLAREGGPAVTARPWGWISPSDTIGGGSGAISRS